MELLSNEFIEMEVMTGPIDGINQDFFVSKDYLNLVVWYNQLLYSPDNTNFPYTLHPGSKKVSLGFLPKAGDALIAFFATSAAPSSLIDGDFPSIVVSVIESPSFSTIGLVPVISSIVEG